MAQPIQFRQSIPNPEEAALRKRLEAVPKEHAAALVEAYDLLEAAHKAGLLQILRAAITAEDAILEKVAGYANTPEGIRLMRNLLVLGRTLAEVDPDLIHNTVKETSATLAHEPGRKPPTLWSLFKRATGPDALLGLSAGISVLEAFGKTFKKRI